MTFVRFRIWEAHREALNQRQISEALRAVFSHYGIRLSDQAVVQMGEGSYWLIIDRKAKTGYRITKSYFPYRLSVSQLSDEDQRRISDELEQELQNKGIRLSAYRKIRVRREGVEWQILDQDKHYQITRRGRLRVRRKEQFHIRNIRSNRVYWATPLPTLKEDSRTNDPQKLLLDIYSQICNSWRQLTEVRFKLLGLVPTISVLVLINVLATQTSTEQKTVNGTTTTTVTSITKGLGSGLQLGVALFGFIVTLALYIYERRNSQLYDDLISRGRKIEEELGIDTGHFRGRLSSSGKLLGMIPIQHDVAIRFIYWTSILGWLIAVLISAPKDGPIWIEQIFAWYSALVAAIRSWLS